MKILLTGTHFTPAQAVIEEFKKVDKIELVYVGRTSTREGDRTPSVESKVVPSLGAKFIPIQTGRLQRSFTMYTIPSLLKVPLGFVQAVSIIRQERPDVVLSFGGYVAVPVVMAAWLFKIPVMLHEQTLVPGLANQISSHFANQIALSFQGSKNSSKFIVTGNPIRKRIVQAYQNEKSVFASEEFKQIIKTADKEKLPVILVTGGNQGSHTLNEVVENFLPELTKIACIIHQTGDSKYQDYEKLLNKQKELEYKNRYLVCRWIDADDFGFVLAHTDLAISRAGINTLLELALFAIPSILIPVPFVSHDEQVVNAKFFTKEGLAKVILQKDLTEESLKELVLESLKNLTTFKKEASKAKTVAHLDAAQNLVKETLSLVKN